MASLRSGVMATDDDDDIEVADDDPMEGLGGPHPLLSPEDRVWRHPSEVAAELRGRDLCQRTRRRGSSGLWPWAAAAAATATVAIASVVLGDTAPSPENRTGEGLAASPTGSAATELTESVMTIEVANARERLTASATVYRGKYLLTAARLVRNAASISVLTSAGSRTDAAVLGFDVHTDLAVLGVDAHAEEVPPAPLRRLRTGMRVTAAISARPTTSESTSVIAKGRRERTPDGMVMYGLARIDLRPTKAITGGAVLDESRHLVGILNAMPFATSSSQPASTVVLPATIAANVADAIIETGAHRHAWLGAVIADLPANSTDFGPRGASITKVRPGSPAAQAGLQPGDRLVTIAGRRTPRVAAVMAALLEFEPGQSTTVGVFAGGTHVERRVLLGESEIDA